MRKYLSLFLVPCTLFLVTCGSMTNTLPSMSGTVTLAPSILYYQLTVSANIDRLGIKVIPQFQWLVGDDADGPFTPISGATSQSFYIDKEDYIGKYITVDVSHHDFSNTLRAVADEVANQKAAATFVISPPPKKVNYDINKLHTVADISLDEIGAHVNTPAGDTVEVKVDSSMLSVIDDKDNPNDNDFKHLETEGDKTILVTCNVEPYSGLTDTFVINVSKSIGDGQKVDDTDLTQYVVTPESGAQPVWATMSSENEWTASVSWFDTKGTDAASDDTALDKTSNPVFSDGTYEAVVTIKAMDGYYIADGIEFTQNDAVKITTSTAQTLDKATVTINFAATSNPGAKVEW